VAESATSIPSFGSFVAKTSNERPLKFIFRWCRRPTRPARHHTNLRISYLRVRLFSMGRSYVLLFALALAGCSAQKHVQQQTNTQTSDLSPLGSAVKPRAGDRAQYQGFVGKDYWLTGELRFCPTVDLGDAKCHVLSKGHVKSTVSNKATLRRAIMGSLRRRIFGSGSITAAQAIS
jgi:hypothetical protein